MIITDRECCGCGLCAARCPQKCISMGPDAEGFAFPSIDETRCTDCGLCRNSCPVNRCAGEGMTPPPSAAAGDRCFYAVSADADQVAKASSGGVFPALALSFLRQGGAVVGAAFDQDFAVELKLVEDVSRLPELMQAKYVQASVPAPLFQQALEFLQSGRPLLFTGTPCQIAAFRSFCGQREYPGLLCAEVICHGVPSPAVWQSYLAFTAQEASAPVSAVYFRDKSVSWHKFALRIDCGGKKIIRSHKESPYMQLFLNEFISRKSCTDCAFKGGRSAADLSLGDFWKLRKIAPEKDNSTGVSMVVVRTDAGMAALQKCSWSAWQEFPMESVKISNRAYFESIPAHPRRDEYFAGFIKGGQQWFDPAEILRKKSRNRWFRKIADIFLPGRSRKK